MTPVILLPSVPDKSLCLPFEPKLTLESFIALSRCLGLPCTHFFCGPYGLDILTKAIIKDKLLYEAILTTPDSEFHTISINGIAIVEPKPEYPYGKSIAFACVKGKDVYPLSVLQVNWNPTK